MTCISFPSIIPLMIFILIFSQLLIASFYSFSYYRLNYHFLHERDYDYESVHHDCDHAQLLRNSQQTFQLKRMILFQ